VSALHAHPLGLEHVSFVEMQLSPHGLPFVHTRQQFGRISLSQSLQPPSAITNTAILIHMARRYRRSSS
jgi:hypothetical protein